MGLMQKPVRPIMIEILSEETMQFLVRTGHMRGIGIKYPRWTGRKYLAKTAIKDWKYARIQKQYKKDKEQARHVLALQIFTGINPEWVEQNLKLGGIMKYLIIFMVMLFSTSIMAEEKKNEEWYVDNWCLDTNNPIKEKGVTEYYLKEDRTRVDCLTKDYAIEFDWGYKLNDSVGQSLGYALRTNRRPGIVLILKEESDIKFWNRLQELILHYHLPIQTWKIHAWEYEDEE